MEKRKIVKGKVKEINKSNLLISFGDRFEGSVSIKEISDYFIEDLNDMFNIGDTISFYVLGYNEKKGKFLLSFKKIRPEYLKKPFKSEISETKNQFNNLFKFTKDEIKKWKK
ncbi:S1 RNA-binding domain-containing protein [Mesomycoplasma neurolyticum]|uniref:30S ribosomal protein s1 n=1 Tax=Mesomycoplasma neurolyticum TaxID=2120 RepID=A0A449A602_9BACT|nr:S1 RNA-binding domain-containing protein [Mesomycoplasma neurolyticum]VEU59652.1 30S ribosomal protein s1 [Mesomycoplasma neurolyticum]